MPIEPIIKPLTKPPYGAEQGSIGLYPMNSESFARVLVESRKYGVVFPVISLDRSFQTHQFVITNVAKRILQVTRPQVFLFRTGTATTGPNTFIGNAGVTSVSGWLMNEITFVTIAVQENTDVWAVNDGVNFPADNTTIFVLEMGI